MDPINFECVKVSLRQNKEGFLLTLAIHPDDFIVNVDRIDKCSNTNNIENKYGLQYAEYRKDIQNTFKFLNE